ncbi:MAG: molybdenum cofactor guanylyltransferase, partial [Chitinophagales bacterium]
AWLVMACDMPLLSPQTLHTLITNRNPNVSASVFYHAQKPSKPLEPLLSIWEPVAYALLKNYVQKGKRSVKGFLEQTNCERIPIQQSIEFSNANTPKENEQIKAYLKNTALTTDIKH